MRTKVTPITLGWIPEDRAQRKTQRERWAAGLAVTLGLLAASAAPVGATLTFFTSEAAWQAAVVGDVQFNFTAANVLLANEVTTLPGPNTGLVSTLTFDAANTGLGVTFDFRCLQPGATFTFDDDEGTGNWPTFDDALAIGDMNNHENDDWEMGFSGGSLTAFGFEFRDSHDFTGESFQVFGAGNTLLGTTTTMPTALDGFLGVVSTSAITRVAYDEDAGGDDIGVGYIRMGTAIPEPSSLLALGLGLLTLAAYRRRPGAKE